jgi:hypothetical protein
MGAAGRALRLGAKLASQAADEAGAAARRLASEASAASRAASKVSRQTGPIIDILADAKQLGRCGGELYGQERLRKLTKYLFDRGVDLHLFDDLGKISGDWSAVRREIRLRRDVTKYEVWHELWHWRHSQVEEWKAYCALKRPRDTEQYVYDMFKSNARWDKLTIVERRDAARTLQRAKGNAW